MKPLIECVIERRPDVSPGQTCTWKLKDMNIRDLFDGAEPGEKVELEFTVMTEDEFEALGEFTGW